MYETATRRSARAVWAKRQAEKQQTRRHELNKRRAASLQQHTPPMRTRRRSRLEAQYQALDAEAKALALRHITDHGDPVGAWARAKDPEWHWKLLAELS